MSTVLLLLYGGVSGALAGIGFAMLGQLHCPSSQYRESTRPRRGPRTHRNLGRHRGRSRLQTLLSLPSCASHHTHRYPQITRHRSPRFCRHRRGDRSNRVPYRARSSTSSAKASALRFCSASPTRTRSSHFNGLVSLDDHAQMVPKRGQVPRDV